jgi:hypothetical protein
MYVLYEPQPLASLFLSSLYSLAPENVDCKRAKNAADFLENISHIRVRASATDFNG